MRIKITGSVLLLCALAACTASPTHEASREPTTADEQPASLAPSQYAKWSAAELLGSTWQLQDGNQIENMAFYPNGFLPITLGVQSPTGPVIMAPVFHWAVDGDGVLVISDHQGKLYKKIYKISVTPERITVNVNGQTQIYNTITRE